MTFLGSDIGLGFEERAGTPPLRILGVPPGGWVLLNFLFYESYDAMHPF